MVPAASRLRLSRPILDGPAAPPQGARWGGTSGNGRPPALRASPGCRDRRWPGVLAVAVLAALVGGSVACGGQHSEFAASASPPPVISAIRPDLAVAGISAAITVTGAHLNEARVTVNGATVAISSDAAASLALTIPGTLLAVGAADMVVTTADGSASAKIPVMAPGNVAAADNPQVAVYSLSVPVAANVAVQFGPTTAYGWPTAAQPVPAGGSANLFVAGMQANVTYHMQARITLPDGSVVLDQDHTFTPMGPDPALLPPLAPTPPTGSPVGGVEMLNVWDITGHKIPVVVADTAGHELWYYSPGETDLEMTPSRLAPDGDIVLCLEAPSTQEIHDRSASGVREITLGGGTVREMRVPALNAALANAGSNLVLAGLSHDVLPLPSGHTVLLAETYKTFSNLTCCPGQSTTLIGPALVDLDANWNVDWWWNGFNYLDPNRIVPGFSPYPPDWTHANALMYTADHDLLLSLRHQCWILKIDYADGAGSGQVLWKLGYQGDFSLAGGNPSQWFYGQHMPEILKDDGHQMTLAVFDDGDYRVLNTSTPPRSSAA
ncbi:MAG: aryl-sulfate sulfotransferase [Terriglobales bacterium]